MRQHMPPGGPVVGPFGAPDIQLVGDALVIENGGKAAGRVGVLVGAAAAEQVDVPAAADLLQDAVIGQVGI